MTETRTPRDEFPVCETRVCGKIHGNTEVSDWLNSMNDVDDEFNEFIDGVWNPVWLETKDDSRYESFVEYYKSMVQTADEKPADSTKSDVSGNENTQEQG